MKKLSMGLQNLGKQKGTYGYLAARKRKTLLFTLLMAAVSYAIYRIGLAHFDTGKNLLTVIAVLGVLPASKSLVGFLTVCRYRSLPKERYEALCDLVPQGAEQLTDMVLTSPEKIMHLHFLVLLGSEIVCFNGAEDNKAEYIERYLAQTLQKRGYAVHVKVMRQEDAFCKRLRELQGREANEEREGILEALYSLMV